MGERTAAGAARAATRREHIEANEQKQRRKVEEHTADGAEHGGDGTRRRARGDRERDVALAQLLNELRVAAREELHRVVLALLIKSDGTLAILGEDDLGHLVRTGLVEQRAVRPRLRRERALARGQGCRERRSDSRRLSHLLGAHGQHGAAGARRDDVVGDGGIQRVRTGGGR